MNQNEQRLIFDEYYKIVDIIQSYDQHYFKIKAWNVTLSGLLLSFGISQEKFYVLVAASVLCFSFWITETWYKVIQNGHFLRAKEIENALRHNLDISYPRIYGAYIEKFSTNKKTRKWVKMMFYPQVMLPHIFILILIFAFLIKSILFYPSIEA